MKIVIFGLSVTSSWGNGHATTYRALIKALAARGHAVTFLERDVAWYRRHRDLKGAEYCRIELYRVLKEVPQRFGRLVVEADLVILGSYVPDGAVLGDWITTHARGVTAFYDIDTPVTLAGLAKGSSDYISAAMIPRFSLYLSFTGGPALAEIEQSYGSPCARALYCSVDPEVHSPVDVPATWRMGYLGTYSEDRQPSLDRFLVRQARRMPEEKFVVAGAQFPPDLDWPANIERIEHLAPKLHSGFYCGQKFTLNITRSDMRERGFSPSVRLFEAAACGVPVITDRWSGLETFFVPDQEILAADTEDDVYRLLRDLPENKRLGIAAAGRKRVLASHTAENRAILLERYHREAAGSRPAGARTEAVA